MDNIVFYKDTIINQEIAFVLDIPYTFISNFEELSSENKVLYIHEVEDMVKAIEFGLKNPENFITFKDVCDYLNKFDRYYDINYRGGTEYKEKLEEINKLDQRYLLLPEMLIKVLYSKPRDINCETIIKHAYLDTDAELWPCCATWTSKSFGNVLCDGDMDAIYHSFCANILKLSCLNKTYCFCDLSACRYADKELKEPFVPQFPKLSDVPNQITIAIDKTCNLRCNSCRSCYYVPSEFEKAFTKAIAQKLIESDWINRCTMLLAGQGEVFFSKAYGEILNQEIKNDEISILSNGTLFNEEKWKLIESKFKRIFVAISIDAATKETYSKLRHGNFDVLLKNLKMLGNLRKENKIVRLHFNYVIQRDNMHEMKEFVLLAKSLNVDEILFTLIDDWDSMTREAFDYANLQITNYLDYKLYKILQDPIFKDPIVNIERIKSLIENSDKYYSEC